MIEYDPKQLERALKDLLSQYRNKERIEAIMGAIFGDSGVQELEDDFRDLRAYHEIENAVGEQLEQWGRFVGEEREGVSDYLYRGFIRARSVANIIDGTRFEMVRLAATLPRVPIRSRIQCNLTGVGGTTIPAGAQVEDAQGNRWQTRTSTTLESTVLLESVQTVFEDGFPYIPASDLDTTTFGNGRIISDVSGWNDVEALEDSVSGVRYRDKFPAGMLLEVTIDEIVTRNVKRKMRAILEDAKPAGVGIGVHERGGTETEYFQLDTGSGHQLDLGKLGSTVGG